MPVHSSHTMRWGSHDRSLLIYARDSSGSGVVGLSAAAEGAVAGYVREGEPPVHLPLDGMSEVDPELVPGVYRLPLPDELLAPGSPHAVVIIRFPQATVDPIDLELVAYDPLDERCLGMAQLQDKTRHEFLRRALPNLTEMEFQAGMDPEKKLTDFLTERGPS